MIGFVAIVDILRERCMDLVSFESPEEYRHFALMMHRGERRYQDQEISEYNHISCADNISSIWTSGRKCNFRNKGCDAAQLQPININGWFVQYLQYFQDILCAISPIFSGYSLRNISNIFRFWSDGNKRIPPTNIPSRLTFWSRWVSSSSS